LRRTRFPDTTQTATAYDELGRRTSETDQAGRTTTYGYDFEGRLVRVTDALNQVTSYTYDQVGNRVSQIDANNHETRFEYDKLGRQTRRVLPDGNFETKVHDPHGRLASRTDFMGRTTTFQYDQRDRLTLKTYPNSTTVRFTYTATGRRLTAVDARGTTSYAYDQRDRPTQLTYPDGRRLNYGYDGQGNRTNLTATIGATSLTTGFTYDDRNQVATVSDPDGRVYTYGYNQNGSPMSLVQPNGVTTSYTYDSQNRLTNLVSRHGTTTLASYAYTLGPTGVRDGVDEADGTSRAFGYDPIYRLTSETVTGSAGTDYAKAFTYDEVGNRLGQVTTGSGAANVAYTYDTRDRMLTAGGVTLNWNDNGNLTGKSGEALYEWDFDDRLVRVTKVDGARVEHVYDADGNRVRTTVTPTTGEPAVATEFLVDTTAGRSHVVAESDVAGIVGAYYVRRGNDLLAVRRNATIRCYLKDGLGSVRGLSDTTGAVTDTKTHSAFGEPLAVTGIDPQPYAFAGEPFEAVSGLAYHRARWLSPGTGRFVSGDPFEGDEERPPTLHRYLYASQDPVNRVDPSGELDFTAGGQLGTVTVHNNLQATSFVSRFSLSQRIIAGLLVGAVGVGAVLAPAGELPGTREPPPFIVYRRGKHLREGSIRIKTYTSREKDAATDGLSTFDKIQLSCKVGETCQIIDLRKLTSLQTNQRSVIGGVHVGIYHPDTSYMLDWAGHFEDPPGSALHPLSIELVNARIGEELRAR
jgi:RHS repeat-associated protein